MNCWPSFTVPDNNWKLDPYSITGDPNDRLSCSCYLNGAPLHLMAGRAWIDPVDECVKFLNAAMEREVMPVLQKVYHGAYHLTPIRGAQYIVWAVPFAD